jgi:uncharacterized protein YsxB (DUF464 family)
MVQAEFFTNKEAGSITMKLSGHAGQAKKGEDIVCAAASILAYTVAQALQFMYEQGDMRKKPHIKLAEGDTVIVAKPKPEVYAEALHIFFVAQVGYHLLAHNYPKYVTLKSFSDSNDEAKHK